MFNYKGMNFNYIKYFLYDVIFYCNYSILLITFLCPCFELRLFTLNRA